MKPGFELNEIVLYKDGNEPIVLKPAKIVARAWAINVSCWYYALAYTPNNPHYKNTKDKINNYISSWKDQFPNYEETPEVDMADSILMEQFIVPNTDSTDSSDCDEDRGGLRFL
jgi:hypothetical protein